MKKNLFLILIFALAACSQGVLQNKAKPAAKAAEPDKARYLGEKTKAIWLRELNEKEGMDFYLEAAQDGNVLSREESDGIVISRRGKIMKVLAKDLIRETERSEVLSGYSKKTGADFMASGGLKVYAYISGELTIAEATTSELGKNFEHALSELTAAVSALPIVTDIAGLLYCDLISEADLPAINKKIAIDGEIEITETIDIKTFPPLMRAVEDPGRMIPLEKRQNLRELSDFINKYDLYGSRAEFIIPTTRGTFACHMKNTYRTGKEKPLSGEAKYEAMDD